MIKFKRSLISSLLTLILLIALSRLQDGTVNTLQPTPIKIPQETQVLSAEVEPDKYLVKKVIDGDTIELDNGQKVRYIGIDSPETVDPRKIVQCFGKEASNKNKELVEGKWVRMEKDVSETDKYKRLLRFVYVADNINSGMEIFVNDYLVRQGFAYAKTYPPDIKFSEQFRGAEMEARNNNRGLWTGCTTQ